MYVFLLVVTPQNIQHIVYLQMTTIFPLIEAPGLCQILCLYLTPVFY